MLTKKDVSMFFGNGLYKIAEAILPTLEDYEEKHIPNSTHISIDGRFGKENCNVTIDEYDTYEAYGNCSCHQFLVNRSCAHCAALMLAYIEYHSSTNITFKVKGVTEQETSYELREMIQEMPSQATNNLYGDIELLPFVDTLKGYDDALLEVDFKVRKKAGKAYVVRDIGSFLQSVEEEYSERYGKGLEFVHTMSAFTQSSQALLKFLLNIMKMTNM